MGCTSSSDAGNRSSQPEDLKRTQQLQRLIATKLREDRMGVINKGMPTLEKRLSCELADSEAVSPLSQEERDAMQTSKAATLAQRRHKNKKAMENAIRENKWMIFSAFDSHEDADLAFLAHFMTTASKSLRRLHDAGSEKSSQMTSPSEVTPSMKRLDSHDSANQSKRMLEQNVTDEILPPPPQDGYIVLKKKLSSRSVIKISTDRLDSSESIINITRKNSSRASIGSTGSAGSGMSLRDTINVAMATSAEGNAATGAASTTAVSSAKSSSSRCKPTGLLSLTSNALEEVEDINNFEIPSGALSMDGVKAIISCYRKNGKLSENSLHKVLRLGYKSLKMLPNTTRVGVGSGERLTVVGDIHGQIWDLLHILDENGLPSASNKYVFNGDFVDRGPFGVEVMCVLLALHSACPSGVHLNRGNHEDFAICTVYGFQNECINKYDDVAFGMFCEIFNHLPLFAIIEDAVFVLHGGLFHATDATLAELDSINRRNFSLGEIAPDTDSLDHIPRYRRDEYLKQLVRDALWSDPMTDTGLGFNPRGAGVAFGPDVARAFLLNNNLKMIVRSHECIRTGFDLPFLGDEKDLLCTVFSASNYCGGDNSAAYMVFSRYDECAVPSAGSVTSSSINSNTEDAIPVPIADTDLVYRIYYYNINSQKEDEVAAELNSQISASRSSSEASIDMSFHDLIMRKKSLILEEFRAIDAHHNRGTKLGGVSTEDWADVMLRVCKLQIRWTMMITELVPEWCISGNTIDYVAFLKSFADTAPGEDSSGDTAISDSQGAKADSAEASQLPNTVIEALYSQHNKLDAVFRFFDQDCDGVISRGEFIDGCEILNAMLDEHEKIRNFDKLLQILDVDESGGVHINEFFEMLRLSEQHSNREGRPEIASLPIIGSNKQRFSLSLGNAHARSHSHRMSLTESFANNTAGPTTINMGTEGGNVMTINIDESPLLSPTVGKSEKRGIKIPEDHTFDI